MTQFKSFLVQKKGNIGFLRLNNPKRLNSLSLEVMKELVDAAQWFDQQGDIKVVIISGEGRAFSAGVDLKDIPKDALKEETWNGLQDISQLGYRMIEAISHMRAITIAQVHGFAIGGAFLLMLACDFRIVEENAFFSIPEVDIGLPLTFGGIPKLVAEIGPAKTKELVMTCRRIFPEEMKSMGLINHIANQDELADHCLKLALQLVAKPALPLRMTKEQVNAVTQSTVSGYSASAEGDMLQNALKDPESQKAARAYHAKILKKKKSL